MNLSFKNGFVILLVMLIVFVSLAAVSAQDNTTQVIQNNLSSSENFDDEVIADGAELSSQKIDTKIEVQNVDSYYKEKADLVACLKDINGTPIKGKQLNIFLNGKEYGKTTDNSGKVSLSLNLKPNVYNVECKFLGDENFTSSWVNSIVEIKKAPLAIKVNNFNTHVHSNLFFKAKVYNKITGNPVDGIRVAFKVYSNKNKKYTYYYRTTNEKGIATLNKDFKVGIYKISTQIKDSKNKKYVSYKVSKDKVTMKVKSTEEFGCCSFYLQISGTESIGGFRRDSTEMANILIKSYKLNGISAVKQYKTDGDYFIHLITTSNGWMIGNGGIDTPDIVKSIEKIAGDMVKSKRIKVSSLKKIQKYKKALDFGHFSIKSPSGKFAVVWESGYIIGKLKPGEYISSPNDRSYYRHGTYAKFGSNTDVAAIKVGATDKFGINRRDITIFHWKSTTDKNYKTTSSIKFYAANDNGKLVGKSTAGLKDNIYFKNKFFSRNILPQSPNMKYLGTHKFGNIDRIIKTSTLIKAPGITCKFNQTKYFKVTVKNKKTGKVVSNIKIKIKISNGNQTKSYIVKTDKKGMAKLNTKDLLIGSCSVAITPANNRYLISAKSKIVIK